MDDPLGEIEALEELDFRERLDREREDPEHSVRALWMPACRQATSIGDLTCLRKHWPPTEPLAAPLDVLQGVAKKSFDQLARAVVGLVDVAIHLSQGDRQVGETLRVAAGTWRKAQKGLTTPARFVAGRWREAPWAPSPTDMKERAAYAAAELVDALAEETAGDAAELDLVVIREVLWYLLDYTRAWPPHHAPAGFADETSSYAVLFPLDHGSHGSVARLSVERREGGTMASFRDPVGGIFLDTDARFEEAATMAWTIVQPGFEGHGVDVRWNLQAEERVFGGSAGAAFAVGFTAAVQRWPEVNPRIAITGLVEEGGAITSVAQSSYRPKLEAAYDRGIRRVLVPAADMDAAMREAHGDLLIQPVRTVNEACDLLVSKWCRVPRRQSRFVPRPNDLASLKRALFEGGPGRGQVVQVWGMSGAGKTTLVEELSRDSDVLSTFEGGVAWVELSSDSRVVVVQRQRDLARFLGDVGEFTDADGGHTHLSGLVEGSRYLVVVDGVQKTADLHVFPVPPRGALIYTTQHRGLEHRNLTGRHEVCEFDEEDAIALLRRWTPEQADHPEAREILRPWVGSPLAVDTVCGMVFRDRAAPDPWAEARRWAGGELVDMVEASMKGLGDDARQRYVDLAVFRGAGAVPRAAVETLWGRDQEAASALLSAFEERSLLRVDSGGLLRFHDVHMSYVSRESADRLPSLHSQLVSAYKACTDGSWASGPDDGYFFQHLAEHLAKAGRKAELRSLLMDFDWMSAKLGKQGLASVLADYDLAPDEAEVRLVSGALRLSAHVLSQDSTQLAGQLIGRLSGQEEPGHLMELLDGAGRYSDHHWLRPLRPSLTLPGGSLISTLAAHDERVTAVAVAPDGRSVLSGSEDRTVRVWDYATGELRRTLTGHSGCVTAVAVTPDGRSAVSGSEDHTVRSWDLWSGELRHELSGHNGPVSAVVIAPDGKSALSSSADQTVRTWDLDSAAQQRSIDTARATAWLVTAADRCWALTSSEDHALQVWDLVAGRVERTMVGHRGRIISVAVTPDGHHVLSASADGTVGIWDLATGELHCALEGHTGPVHAVVVAPDGRHAVSGSADRTVRVWDLATGRLERTLVGHSGSLTALAVMPDGQHVVSAGADRTLRVWNLGIDRTPRTAADDGTSVTALAVSRDGRRAISGSVAGRLVAWDLKTGSAHGAFVGHDKAVSAVALSADGRRGVSGAGDGSLRAWDAETGVQTGAMFGLHWIEALALSTDGRVAVAGSGAGTVQVWDCESSEPRRSFDGHEGRVTAVGLSLVGRIAVSAGMDQTLRVWDVEPGRLRYRMTGHEAEITTLAVAPGGGWALSGSEDQTLRRWNLDTGEGKELGVHGARITALAMMPDGRKALSGAADGSLRMWDIDDGLLLSLAGHQASITAIASTLDGRLVVSASRDRTIRAWHLGSGERLATFTADSAIQTCAVASNKGVTLVCGDDTGAVHILRLCVMSDALTPHRS